MTSIKLGDLLLKAKALSSSQLSAALAEQQKWGGKLGEILVRMNILTEDLLVRALAKQLSLPAANLDSIAAIPPHVREKIPPDLARDLSAIALQLKNEGHTLVVAMAEPQNLDHVDTLHSVSGCRIEVQVAGRLAIARAFGRFYGKNLDSLDEERFALTDAAGNTVVKAGDKVMPKRTTTGDLINPLMASGQSPAELLQLLDEAQRKEIAALKAIVELMIEKGVFSRDEYLAKVKR